MSDARDDVAAAILRYLEAHPDAADTPAGIRDWWLGNSGASLSDVNNALERLVRLGTVECILTTGVAFRARRR